MSICLSALRWRRNNFWFQLMEKDENHVRKQEDPSWDKRKSKLETRGGTRHTTRLEREDPAYFSYA